MPLWPKIATALLYLAAGGLFLFLAHRRVRRLTLLAATLLLLLPLAFTGRALLTGRSYAPYNLAYYFVPLSAAADEYDIGPGPGILQDVHSAIIPWHQAVRHAYSHRQWPLLDPFLLCGDPLAGTAQPAPYYPINVLTLVLPLPLALTLGASLQLLLAALAAFLWTRELGCREEAAAVAAAAWALSSFVGFWLEWPLGVALSLAPLVLLGVRRTVAEPGVRAAMLLASALLLASLAGHPESLVHLVAIGIVAGLAEMVVRRGGGVRAVLRILGWTLAAGAVTLGLAAIFLLPILEVLPQTLEWNSRMSMTEAVQWSRPFPEVMKHLGRSLLPPQDASPGDFFQLPLASAYAGALLLAPALYGLARGRRNPRLGLAALGLFGLLAGARAPGVQEIFAHVPLLRIAINERLVFLVPLALSGLAALGVEAWIPRGGARGSRGLGALAAALAFLASAGGWLIAPAAISAGVEVEDLRAMVLWAAVPLAVAAALLILLPAPRAALALVAILAIERAGEMGSFYPTVDPDAFYPPVPPIDALEPLGQGEPFRIVGHRYALLPNHATHWALEDPRGYQAIHHRRFAETVPLWSIQDGGWFNRVDDLSTPFLSFLNVRYALTEPNLPLQDQGWRLTRRGEHSWLWTNPKALGRAFVPRRVRLGAGHDQRLREMKGESDFQRLAWIEPPGEDPQSPGTPVERRNSRGWAVTTWRGTGLHLTARLRQPGWVVISQTAWNGWRAVSDGRELPLGIANHAFLALELPAGLHEVDLFYRPRAFDLGLAVSGATAGLLALAAVAWRWRHRRTGEVVRGPDREAGARRTGDRIAIPGAYQHRAYHEGPAPQRFWTRARIEESAALLAIGPGQRVLDAGCGSGLMAARAVEAGAAEVLGVDANPEAIEFARSTYAHPAVHFRAGLVDQLDLAPGSFDRISFLEVIEHVGRPQGAAVLVAFHRFLAPGGRLVISTPNRASLWPLLEFILDRLHVPRLRGEQHETLYTLAELAALAEAAGFKLAEWRMINTFAPWVAWLSPRLAATLHRWEVRHIRRHGSVMVVAFERNDVAL